MDNLLIGSSEFAVFVSLATDDICDILSATLSHQRNAGLCQIRILNLNFECNALSPAIIYLNIHEK